MIPGKTVVPSHDPCEGTKKMVAAAVACAKPSHQPPPPPSKQAFIVDFGQNIAGVVRLKAPAQPKEGQTITVRHCEVLEVRKRRFFSHFYINAIILPRQARDKHRKNSKKGRFLAAPTPLRRPRGCAQKKDPVLPHALMNAAVVCQDRLGSTTEDSWKRGCCGFLPLQNRRAWLLLWGTCQRSEYRSETRISLFFCAI